MAPVRSASAASVRWRRVVSRFPCSVFSLAHLFRPLRRRRRRVATVEATAAESIGRRDGRANGRMCQAPTFCPGANADFNLCSDCTRFLATSSILFLEFGYFDIAKDNLFRGKSSRCKNALTNITSFHIISNKKGSEYAMWWGHDFHRFLVVHG